MKNFVEKLEDVMHHGYGNHVILISTGYKVHQTAFLEDIIQKKYKVHYLFLSLNSPNVNQEAKLINSLNYYHYASSIVMDYPAFLIFLKNIERINLSHKQFEKLVIYNPFELEKPFWDWFKDYITGKSYMNLFGKFIKSDDVKNRLKLSEDLLSQLFFINTKHFHLIGRDSKPLALKIASKVKNSKIDICDEYEGFLKVIKKEFK